MTTLTTTPTRYTVCGARLAIDDELAVLVADRNVAACAHVVDLLRATLDDALPGSCCKPTPDADGDPGYRPACTHLRRLWDARTYLELAKANAPTTGAYGCQCSGSGKFYSGGAIVNGEYTGTIGECFRCAGKGYQTDTDRKRNEYYDNNVRVIRI